MPRRVKVGPVIYEITDDPDAWMRIEHREQKTGNYGYTDNLAATIYVNPEAAPSVKRLTLLHEVMHGCVESMMGATDWRNLGKDSTAREESVIRAWESPLLSIIRDNPVLVAYLSEAAE